MRKYFCFSIKRGKVTNNCQLLFAKRTLFIPTVSFFMSIRNVYRCIGIFDNRADSRAHASGILNAKCMHSTLSVRNALIVRVLSSVDNQLMNLHNRVHLSAHHTPLDFRYVQAHFVCHHPRFTAMGERNFCCSDRKNALPLCVWRPAVGAKWGPRVVGVQMVVHTECRRVYTLQYADNQYENKH